MKNTYKTQNIALDALSVRNMEVDRKQKEMIDNLRSIGLLNSPTYNLNCEPSAYFYAKISGND
ncbi:hypothetical protein PSI22_21305 [Xenorhabdus sp. XENO-7]|uniref:Uncharacterized protein n=1 Tax=Xenorhabdus aichiensis TaxID=3025874 RepID=A0ABT5M978_9GAMM|nr:hypothetical protein [Xenorhabdus aichiensis]MDC9624092.1 hypothetical protein [Xenorhabdus aichiensis]